MKFLPLVWRNLMRRKIRTFITVLMSIVVAFVLFGALMAIRAAFSMGVDVAGADRLMMIHKVSIIQPLPRSYDERIRATEGVTARHRTPTGSAATTRSRPTSSQSMAVDPETWLQMYPEFELPADQKKTWLADRTGAVVGVDLAQAVSNWKIGDRVPLLAPIYQQAARAAPWDFTIDGIYDSAEAGRRQDAVLLPATTISTRRCGRCPAWPIRSAGTSSASPTRRRRISSPSASTRCSPTPDRNQDGDREGVRLRLGQAGRRHRQHHDRDHRRRHVLHPLRRRQLRWRNRFASASTSWACSRRSASATAGSWRWCCSSPAPSRSSAAGSGC